MYIRWDYAEANILSYVLKSYNMFSYFDDNSFLLTGHPPHTEIRGADNPIAVGNQNGVSCHIKYYLAIQSNFTWFLGSEEITSHSFEVLKEDNLANYQSVLDYSFSRYDDISTLTCKFLASGDLGLYENSTSTVVSLYCEYFKICPPDNG